MIELTIALSGAADFGVNTSRHEAAISNPEKHSHPTGPQTMITIDNLTTRKLSGVGTLLAFSFLTSACVTLSSAPTLQPLPSVDPGNAATLKVRSTIRVTEVVQNHILRLDGQRIALFEQDDREEFTIAAGPHLLGLSCHSRVKKDDSDVQDLPHNYNVADGNATLDISPEPGETLCVKIKPALLNCAAFELVDPSYCVVY